MQQFLCPQCGASVSFQSPGAVMVVCGACRSTLTRDGESARRIGQLADVVEDGSLIQIGTRGREGQRAFQVLGRLRMRYEAGGWNEWYIAFDDGANGWLSDASGQYALTRRDAAAATALLPDFTDLRAGGPIKVSGVLYTVSDIRLCRCVGGEGELPLQAGDGWDARVVDGRRGADFVTVDYSDDAPVVYTGASGRLQFEPGTLRRKEDIEASTGRYRGQVLAMDCPNCAGSVSIAVAMATQVVCPSCSSLLDCSGERAEIIEAQRRQASFQSTLKLGARGGLNGVDHTVIGILRCGVPDDDSEPSWTEYLLFNPQRGYLWLVETQERWQRVTVCDEWPAQVDESLCRWRKRSWVRKYAYDSHVEQVFGAFNWRVRKGDTTRIVDCGSGSEVLTREQSGDEVVWSHAVELGAVTVAHAFGLPVASVRKDTPEAVTGGDDDEEQGELLSIAVFATFLIIAMHEEISAAALMVGLVLIWVPLLLAGQIGASLRTLGRDG